MRTVAAFAFLAAATAGFTACTTTVTGTGRDEQASSSSSSSSGGGTSCRTPLDCPRDLAQCACNDGTELQSNYGCDSGVCVTHCELICRYYGGI